MSDLILPPGLPSDLPVDRMVGITTTVPVEIIFAARLIPVDLNNLFITAPDPQALADLAERAGFPRTCCCWTKGIYGGIRRYGIRRVVGVTRGDCSNAEALLEVLRHEGGRPVGFDYPGSTIPVGRTRRPWPPCWRSSPPPSGPTCPRRRRGAGV